MKKAQGIIIHSINFKEHDKIYTIFTKEFGKISARARGVRKIQSKFGPHLQPFLPLSLELISGKHWYTITFAKIRNSYHSFLSPDNLFIGAFIGEILYKTLPDEEVNEDLFDMLSNFLNFCEQSDNNDMKLLVFILHYLKHTGHNIELTTCLHCHKEKPRYFLSLEESGVVCHDCISETKAFPENYRKYLLLLQSENFFHNKSFLEQQEISEDDIKKLARVCEQLFLKHFPLQIQSRNMF